MQEIGHKLLKNKHLSLKRIVSLRYGHDKFAKSLRESSRTELAHTQVRSVMMNEPLMRSEPAQQMILSLFADMLEPARLPRSPASLRRWGRGLLFALGGCDGTRQRMGSVEVHNLSATTFRSLHLFVS